MAKQLRGNPLPKKRRSYPWGQWTNGKTWVVKQGEDFDMSLVQFRTYLHERSRKFGQQLQTQTDRDAGTITFRFYGKR